MKNENDGNKENTDMERYDPNYTYNNKHIAIDKKNNDYPIIEMTVNGLLYPDKIKDNMDVEEFDEENQENTIKKED